MWAWGPVTNPTARALASWLCALWGRHEGARGGRLLPVCGASGVRRSPTADRLLFGACCRGPPPTGCGCGGCGRGDPSPTPQCAPLRAGFARCGGGKRAPGGGASCLCVGRPGLGALPFPTARPLGCAAGAHWPLAVGAGGVGVGTPQPPHSARSLRAGFARCGGGTGAPRGGRLLPLCGASGVRRFPTPDRSSFLSVLPGPITHWLWVRGAWAWVPVTNPTARAFAGCGGCTRAPRGGASCLCVGCPGSGALPPPTARPLRRAARAHHPRCRHGDPSPTPLRALLRAGFVHCNGGTRAPGGGAPCLCVWRPGWSALPAPTARPLGRAAGAHYPLAVGAGGAGVGTRHQPHSARSRELALRPGGRHEGARGAASCLCVGRPGAGALPTPTARSLGRAAGAHYPP